MLEIPLALYIYWHLSYAVRIFRVAIVAMQFAYKRGYGEDVAVPLPTFVFLLFILTLQVIVYPFRLLFLAPGNRIAKKAAEDPEFHEMYLLFAEESLREAPPEEVRRFGEENRISPHLVEYYLSSR